MRGTPYARTSAPNIMTGTFKPIAAPDTRMTSPMTQTMSCALSRPRITRVADSRLNDAAGTFPPPVSELLGIDGLHQNQSEKQTEGTRPGLPTRWADPLRHDVHADTWR